MIKKKDLKNSCDVKKITEIKINIYVKDKKRLNLKYWL